MDDDQVKCPECNAPTSVKETRGNKRRRVCFNDHLFTTYEEHKPQITHAEGCWAWGPRHYHCALNEIKNLQDELDAKSSS